MKQSYFKLVLLIFIGFSILKPTELNAQCVAVAEDTPANPKRDMRGVFLPSLFSISWPSDRNAAPAVQQAELIGMLDDMKANNYNSVFLQVRPECDALYASTIEPWSYWLTGTEGTAPSPLWDPLQFAIDEAHARGMDLHAWLNPYRSKRGSQTRAANHVSVLHPDWVFTASNNAAIEIMDPGLPAVEAYVVSVVEDIASRYDVDGIHFDDYFYPSGGMTTNQDATTYANYNPGSLSLANWRRDNVNRMITEVYDAIQTINTNDNKNISFGVSPFGIWKSGTPPGISGTSSFSALYCDPIAWMQAGKVDYIAPQLYWAFGGSQDYDILSQWWNDQADIYNTQLYISQAYYKMDSPWNWAATELQNQIDENREPSMDVTFGQIAYRYNEIDTNFSGINTALNGTQFQYKSFVKPLIGAGKDALCAENPLNARFGSLKLEWDTPAAASDGDFPEKYVVYEFNSAAQASTDFNDGTRIFDIVAGNEVTLTQTQIDTKFFIVTSLDKNNNEAGDFCNFPLDYITAPCSVASITAPTAKKNCSGSYTATTSTVFPIESSTVVLWNYDFGGGETYTQSQNVVITDATAPIVVTQNIVVTLTAASVSITPTDINNGSSDNCNIDTMSLDIDTFSCADIGVNTVMLTVTDKNGNSASAPANVTVQGELTEYTGAGWSNGVPHLGSLAKISSAYSTSIGSIDTCACEVTATGTLTVEAGDYLKVDGNILVDGSLIVEHQGSVVQVNPTATVTKNGTINVKLTTPVLSNRDFMVMGSPMDSELRTGVFSSAFLVLNSTPANFMPHAGVPTGGTNFADNKLINGKFWDAYTGAITKGEGFIVRPQTGYGDPAVTSYNMTYALGTLNNGDVSRPIIFNGLTDNPSGTPNILANPYASAISASTLIANNALINEVYFWEHLTPPSTSLPGSNTMNFSMDDISIYNGSMGIPAANDPGTSTTPNGVISTGQGFAIKAQAAGTITFSNSMRLNSGNSTLRNASTEVPTEQILLEVRNADYGVGSYTGLAFTSAATFSEDTSLDTQRLATIVSLYSHYEDGTGQLGIQSLPAFEDGMKIPFGFTTQVPAELEYVISVANVEGTHLTNATVYLIDNMLGSITNLSETDYTFKSGKHTYDNRFTIQFESESILGTTDVDLASVILYPNPTAGELNISSVQNPITGIIVYDVQGRKVNEVAVNSERDYTIDVSQLEQGVYFVAVTTENGMITKRIIKK